VATKILVAFGRQLYSLYLATKNFQSPLNLKIGDQIFSVVDCPHNLLVIKNNLLAFYDARQPHAVGTWECHQMAIKFFQSPNFLGGPSFGGIC